MGNRLSIVLCLILWGCGTSGEDTVVGDAPDSGGAIGADAHVPVEDRDSSTTDLDAPGSDSGVVDSGPDGFVGGGHGEADAGPVDSGVGPHWEYVRTPGYTNFYDMWGASATSLHVTGAQGFTFWNEPSLAIEPTTFTPHSSPYCIEGFASNDIWAGISVSGATTLTGELWHYDGTNWARITAIPFLPLDMWGSASDDIFVLGAAQLMHYDGEGWSDVSLAGGPVEPDFKAISGIGDELWTLSEDHDSCSSWACPVEVWRLQGGSWQQMYRADDTVGGSFVTSAHWSDIFVYDATHVYITYQLLLDSPADHSVVKRWDGSSWSEETLPLMTGRAEFRNIWALGPDDVFVTGNDRVVGPHGSDTMCPAIYHFNGANWERMPMPTEIADQETGLWSVWGLDRTHVYGLGNIGGMLSLKR